MWQGWHSCLLSGKSSATTQTPVHPMSGNAWLLCCICQQGSKASTMFLRFPEAVCVQISCCGVSLCNLCGIVPVLFLGRLYYMNNWDYYILSTVKERSCIPWKGCNYRFYSVCPDILPPLLLPSDMDTWREACLFFLLWKLVLWQSHNRDISCKTITGVDFFFFF